MEPKQAICAGRCGLQEITFAVRCSFTVICVLAAKSTAMPRCGELRLTLPFSRTKFPKEQDAKIETEIAPKFFSEVFSEFSPKCDSKMSDTFLGCGKSLPLISLHCSQVVHGFFFPEGRGFKEATLRYEGGSIEVKRGRLKLKGVGECDLQTKLEPPFGNHH